MGEGRETGKQSWNYMAWSMVTHMNRKTGVGRVIGDWSGTQTDHYTPHFDFFTQKGVSRGTRYDGLEPGTGLELSAVLQSIRYHVFFKKTCIRI